MQAALAMQPAASTAGRPWRCGAISRPFASPSHAQRRRVTCHAEEVRKRKAFGEWLLETEDPSQLEQPEPKDFWEGSQFDLIGKSAGFAVPVLVVLLILVGFFAAGSYDSGATAVLQPPQSPEDTARILQLKQD